MTIRIKRNFLRAKREFCISGRQTCFVVRPVRSISLPPHHYYHHHHHFHLRTYMLNPNLCSFMHIQIYFMCMENYEGNFLLLLWNHHRMKFIYFFYFCRSHFSANAVLDLLVNIVRKLMLVRHRHAPTTAFVSIYRKDMREIVISAYVHTVSGSISLTNYDLYRQFHVFI